MLVVRKLLTIGPYLPCRSIAQGKTTMLCFRMSPMTASPLMVVDSLFESAEQDRLRIGWTLSKNANNLDCNDIILFIPSRRSFQREEVMKNLRWQFAPPNESV